MTKFGDWILGKWYPGWHTSGSVGDLANLAAQLEGALDAFLDSKTELRIACPTCIVALTDKGRLHEDGCPAVLAKTALEACKEFQEKYTND